LLKENKVTKQQNTPQLNGYIRSDKRVGFRNYIAVIPLAGCAQEVARRIADKVESAALLSQPLGCDLEGPDQQRLGQILYRLATHPNVGAALFITLGCAAANCHKIADRTDKTGRSVKTINIQLAGGTSASVRAGVEAVQQMSETLKLQQRVEVPISSIVLGTKCGASDQTTYEICHPVMSDCSDMLVEAGATVVLSEDFELYAACNEIAARAVDEDTAKKIKSMARRLRQNFKSRCGKLPEDVLGDMQIAHEISLARASKAGTKPITKVVSLGEVIDAKGLVILDAPNSDLVSITSLASAGCNMIAFTTGRGTLVASPVAPTIKITGNVKTYQRMNENTDLLVSNRSSQAACELFDAIIDCANGRPTKAELVGHGEMFVPLEGVTF